MSPAPDADTEFHCITCSDEGCEMEVISVDAPAGLAECDVGDGQASTVQTLLIDNVVVGDVLLVHAGAALTRIRAAVTT